MLETTDSHFLDDQKRTQAVVHPAHRTLMSVPWALLFLGAGTTAPRASWGALKRSGET